MTDKALRFRYSILAPIPEGSSAREAFSHSLDLARVWLKSQAIIATGWQNTTI
ncbi:hypothetical protein ACLB1M_25235 [Escherichia coli]